MVDFHKIRFKRPQVETRGRSKLFGIDFQRTIKLFILADHIPISFTCRGQQYTGELAEVSGMGGTTWHLMINRYYWGSVRQLEGGFVFHGNSPATSAEFNEMADYFETVLIGWYE